VIALTVEARCEHCQKQPRILLAMSPGDDGLPWYLCVRCWLDGLMQGKESRATGITEAEPAPPTAGPDRKIKKNSPA
jgi:hypothetical protein